MTRAARQRFNLLQASGVKFDLDANDTLKEPRVRFRTDKAWIEKHRPDIEAILRQEKAKQQKRREASTATPTLAAEHFAACFDVADAVGLKGRLSHAADSS